MYALRQLQRLTVHVDRPRPPDHGMSQCKSRGLWSRTIYVCIDPPAIPARRPTLRPMHTSMHMIVYNIDIAVAAVGGSLWHGADEFSAPWPLDECTARVASCSTAMIGFRISGLTSPGAGLRVRE